jgi:hypothetical protein
MYSTFTPFLVVSLLSVGDLPESSKGAQARADSASRQIPDQFTIPESFREGFMTTNTLQGDYHASLFGEISFQ